LAKIAWIWFYWPGTDRFRKDLLYYYLGGAGGIVIVPDVHRRNVVVAH